MPRKTSNRLLIANRGEIVCRIARTAQRLGWTADRGLLRRGSRRAACARRGRGVLPGAVPGGPKLSRPGARDRSGAARRRRRGASGLWVSVGECGFRASLRRCGIDLRRSAAGGDSRHGLEERLQGGHGGGRGAGGSGLSRRRTIGRAAGRRGRARRISVDHQGERRRRRQGHAGGALGRRGRRRPSSRRSVWRAPRSATTGCCSSAISEGAARRGAGVRRRPRRHRGACSIAIARCSAGIKRSSRRRRRPACGRKFASAMAQAADHGGACGRLRGRGHGRVPARRGAELLLHGNEYPAAGRASGHRTHHRHRPGGMAAADRPRRAAARGSRSKSPSAAPPSRRGSMRRIPRTTICRASGEFRTCAGRRRGPV